MPQHCMEAFQVKAALAPEAEGSLVFDFGIQFSKAAKWGLKVGGIVVGSRTRD